MRFPPAMVFAKVGACRGRVSTHSSNIRPQPAGGDTINARSNQGAYRGSAPTGGRRSAYGDAAEEHQQGAEGVAHGWRGNTVPRVVGPIPERRCTYSRRG